MNVASRLALFGDLEHPTTRLACAAVAAELAVADAPKRTLVLGEGLTAIAEAAARVGNTELVAIDADDAVAARVREAAPTATVRTVSVADYLATEAGGAFDLVVVNLPDPPLLALLPELCAAASPNGVLVATGVLAWQADAIIGLARAFGAAPAEDPVVEGGWCAVRVRC